MASEHGNGKGSAMVRLATWIVDKRKLLFLIFVILLAFSAVSRNWVKVENDLTFYLPDTSETKQALDIMDDQFTTFGTAKLMVANITYTEAEKISQKLETVKGVQQVEFDDTEDHYNNVSAMFQLTFDYDEDDSRCLDSLEAAKEAVAGYDIYVYTSLGNAKADTIEAEIKVIMVMVAIVVTIVLIFTSQTYAEVPVLLLTFVVAMVVNQGTNFFFGTISFVSNSVTSVLQLALSLDYAVILCNRYKEERKEFPVREAAIVALSKAIPEISASSLTTIGGMAAMLFMQFKLGGDMGMCLIKAIIFALLTVFFLMPGLLVLFAPLMEKTAHRNFVPKISFVGKVAYKTKHIIPPIFLGVVVVAMLISQHCPYVYGYSTLTTPKLNATQIAENTIRDNFGQDNYVAIVIPGGDSVRERELLDRLDSMPEVKSTTGIANAEAMDGYCLADELTPRQFSELADVSYEQAQLLYAAYAAENEDYGKIINDLPGYQLPLMDIFMFTHDQVDSGIVTVSDEKRQDLDDAYEKIHNAQLQLQGKDYSRLLVYLNLPVSGEETYNFIDTLRETAQTYYPDGTVLVAGDSTSEYDFQKSFSRDNVVVSVVSILIVLFVLLFTFKSVGMPLLLILLIQGSIWINFTVPALTHSNLFFLGYLVVSSIQMGANIDYAIVIASRFSELKDTMPKKQAMVETMNFAFPTIITSGAILAIAGMLIGSMTSEAAIAGIGDNLGRGTLLSIGLVMFVLPQILLFGEKIVDKTSFSMPRVIKRRAGLGRMRVNGVVHGEVFGTVSGVMNAVVDGKVDVKLLSGSVEEEDE